jgi:DNA-binding winged helix-turn-helix (wHTH) protein
MKLRGRGSIRFGRIELDPANAILRKDGVIVKLSAQPLKALTLLASRPNELVTREELRQAIWGTALVVDFEHGLNTCIRQIRTALGEPGAAQSVIETVPRLGYRFKGEVRRRPLAARGTTGDFSPCA